MTLQTPSEDPICPSERYSKRAKIEFRNGDFVCLTYLSSVRASGFEPDSEYCPTCKYNPEQVGQRVSRDLQQRGNLTIAQKDLAKQLGASASAVFSAAEKALRGVRKNGD